MSSFEVISFYTENTPYEDEAQNLISDLKKYGLSADHVCSRKNLKNWHKNCCQKPYFIDEKLKELNKPILWIDADARVIQYPELISKLVNSKYEIAAHYKDHEELLSGTLFMKPTDNIFKILYFWKELLYKDMVSAPGVKQIWPGLEQSALQYLLKEKYDNFNNVEVYTLPKEYTHVGDLLWFQDVKNPVITHTQASRRYKNKLDN